MICYGLNIIVFTGDDYQNFLLNNEIRDFTPTVVEAAA